MKVNIEKNYEQKEDIILDKHQVSKEDYAAALECYQDDPMIQQSRQEILDMMSKAYKG